MKRKFHTPEQIVKKFREADAAIASAVPSSRFAGNCKSVMQHTTTGESSTGR
jgi:hypothetical protein